MQDNDIINLLGIKDSTIKILSVATKDTEKTVEFEKRIELHCTALLPLMRMPDAFQRGVSPPGKSSHSAGWLQTCNDFSSTSLAVLK